MQYQQNNGPNNKGWKMQNHINLKLIFEFQQQLDRAKQNKHVRNI